MINPDQAEAVFYCKRYRNMIKDLSDQAGILSPMELSRALAELAFQVHPEAAVITVQELELRRVK